MTFASNVAPRRRIRQEKHRDWYCNCNAPDGGCVKQSAAIKRCLECLGVRP